MKGTIGFRMALILTSGIAAALVAGFALQVMTQGKGAVCRSSRLDEAQLLGEKLTKMCRQDHGQSKLVYDFTECIDTIEFKRLPPKEKRDEGGGKMGVVANYSGSWQPYPLETQCDEFRIAGRDFKGAPNLSLPGGHRYTIIVSAVREEEGGRWAQINITNFGLSK